VGECLRSIFLKKIKENKKMNNIVSGTAEPKSTRQKKKKIKSKYKNYVAFSFKRKSERGEKEEDAVFYLNLNGAGITGERVTHYVLKGYEVIDIVCDEDTKPEPNADVVGACRVAETYLKK
jgi:hypothetical protein